MRPQTERQAMACEHAQSRKCQCRCRGAVHGLARDAQLEQDSIEKQTFFFSLPEDDPHHASGRKQLRLPFKSESHPGGATTQDGSA